MGKSRKHKGGNPTSVDCTKHPGLCPTSTGAGGSLTAITKKGIDNQKAQAETMTKANAALVGGGKRKKGGAAQVICPQPAAGSGGSITAGGSSAGANMCEGLGTSQQQGADAVGDSTDGLSTAPPCDTFSGQCGGKRRRRRKTRRRRRKSKKKSKRRRKTKKRRGRKSRRHRKRRR